MEAIEIEYPALLEVPAPILRAYPPETVVAEKTEAIVSLGIANSRMKDFYDLWMIAQTFTFEFATPADAIQQTFERRRTSLPEQVPIGLSDSFALEREAQWRAFLARAEVASWPPGGPWTEVVDP